MHLFSDELSAQKYWLGPKSQCVCGICAACVRACARARARVCVCVCVRVYVCVSECVEEGEDTI